MQLALEIWDRETGAVLWAETVQRRDDALPPFIEWPTEGRIRRRFFRLYHDSRFAAYEGPVRVEVSA